MRSMVEGGCRERQNCISRPIDVSQNILREDPDQAITRVPQKSLPHLVTLRPVTYHMNVAVDFDDQSRCCAVEIHNVRIDRMLFAKAHATWRAFQTLPKEHFWQRHGAPQATGFVHGASARRRGTPSTTSLRCVVPLPVPGRI